MKKEAGIIASSLVFLAGHLSLVAYDHYWFALLPLLGFLVLASFFKPEQVLFFIVLATPLSLNFEELGLGIGAGLSIPTEPMMAGMMLLFLWKVLYEGFPDRRILQHPMSILVLIYLGWTLVTTLTSTMFIVSLKYFLAQSWFITSFYFLPLYFFRERKWLERFPWAYTLPLIIVAVYTLIRHAAEGFAEEPAHFLMTPFYKDHTSYGAALALCSPLIIEKLFSKKLGLHYRIGLFFLLALFAVAIVFSYTRATWVSLLGALLVLPFLLLKIPFKYPVLLVMIAGAFVYSNQDRLYMQLKESQPQSSATSELEERVQSISNVASNASNLERINRWKTAWRMFQEHPVFGFGPGTYQFQYAPYQDPGEKTIISTDFGTRGRAHSEYLGPLSEMGALGFLIRIALVSYLFYLGFRLYRELPKGRLRGLSTALYLGLVTYFTHGVLNNFLNRDKAAVPVWSFIAIMVAIDLYHKDRERRKKELGSGDAEGQ